VALIEVISDFLTEYAVELGALGGIAGVLTVIWAVITKPFQRSKPTALAQETIDQIKPAVVKDVPSMTITDFIRLRRELKADLEEELAQADSSEKDQLRARISELESQIANPDASLAEAQKRIRDLEDILERAGNEIDADRIAEARVALEQGDYSVADDIFAEIEAREQMAVQNAARAAGLSPDFDALNKASEFAYRSGDYAAALKFANAMNERAQEENDKPQLLTAMDHVARAHQYAGNYAAAEPMFRAAKGLVAEVSGEVTQEYAASLNNLAELLRQTGGFAEAELLYREALEIDLKTIGKEHPDHAIHLNNLALLLTKTGDFAEAESLYSEAMEIDLKTIGAAHPSYAIRLSNLAALLIETDRYDAADPLFREALAVFEAALGAEHPHTKTASSNLEGFLANRP
jgi:tetratricopeptide (TPR) repeat protein